MASPEITLDSILQKYEKPKVVEDVGAGKAEDKETEMRIRAELEKKWAEEAEKNRNKGKKHG